MVRIGRCILKYILENIQIVGLCLFSSILSLLYFDSTSPFINGNGGNGAGGDSAYFLLIGNLLSENKVFYVDLFDHKGPILFFLNGIPQLFIDGSVGVWILQNIFMIISLLLIYKLSKMILKNRLAVLPAIIYLAYNILTISGGNFSEEYSNLFCVISIYIMVDVVENGLEKLSCLKVGILGVCIMVIALIRVNNAVIVGTVILCLLILVIKEEPCKVFKYLISEV